MSYETVIWRKDVIKGKSVWRRVKRKEKGHNERVKHLGGKQDADV